ncbi:hypothetical protein D3C72_1406070 [compost metagenome]
MTNALDGLAPTIRLQCLQPVGCSFSGCVKVREIRVCRVFLIQRYVFAQPRPGTQACLHFLTDVERETWLVTQHHQRTQGRVRHQRGKCQRQHHQGGHALLAIDQLISHGCSRRCASRHLAGQHSTNEIVRLRRLTVLVDGACLNDLLQQIFHIFTWPDIRPLVARNGQRDALLTQ